MTSRLFCSSAASTPERLFGLTAYILCGAFLVVLALFMFHYRLLNTELRAREQAEASLRSLSVRLLELQDQERRKFSRELHDSLGQYLVGVKMNLTILGNSVRGQSLHFGVHESVGLGHDRNPNHLAFVASAAA